MKISKLVVHNDKLFNRFTTLNFLSTAWEINSITIWPVICTFVIFLLLKNLCCIVFEMAGKK